MALFLYCLHELPEVRFTLALNNVAKSGERVVVTHHSNPWLSLDTVNT